MKAFFYTVFLTAVVVGSIILLRFLDVPTEGDGTGERPRKTAVTTSETPQLSSLRLGDLRAADAATLYETGVELFDLWHMPEAVEVFEAVVDKDPDHLQAHMKLVECYSHPLIGKEERAESCWRSARDIAFGAGRDTLIVSAFKDLFIDGTYDRAVDRLRKAAKSEEANDEVGYYLALALLRSGRATDAGRNLEDLLDADESRGRVRELLVRCKVVGNDLDGAVALVRDLAAIYPEEPFPYVLLAQVLLVQGKMNEAEEFSNNALLLDAKYIPAIVTRANLYSARGEREAARVSFEKLLLFDDPILHSIGTEGIAHTGFLNGRFDEAAEEMDEAIRLAMGAGSTRRGLFHAFQLVEYLCELGRTDAARGVVERWINRTGRIPAQLGELIIGISEGNIETSRHVLGQIRDNDAWQTWMRSLSLDYGGLQALALIKEKKFAEALNLLGSQNVGSIDQTKVAYFKGYASFEKGDAESATRFFEESTGRLQRLEFPYHGDPVLHVQSVFYLAEAAVARGEIAEAKKYYEEFLRYWGRTKWDLKAVKRAREKLATLALKPPKS